MNTVTLSERAQKIVEKQLASGDFEGPDAVVEAALALLQADDEAYWAMVREKVEEALEDVAAGRVYPLNAQTIGRIKARARATRDRNAT